MKPSILKAVYLVSAFFLVITGFGQMPIYKRYYISEIPGLGWIANFYTTHYLHYVFGAILIGAAAYALAAYFLFQRKTALISKSGYLRSLLLLGIIVTGLFLVIFNLPGLTLPQGFVIFLDLAHMGLAVAFLVAGLLAVILGHRWVTA